MTIIVDAWVSFNNVRFPERYVLEGRLGLAPQASRGTMVRDGLGSITTTMPAFDLFGDGLRDAVDPSTRA